jgi:hypothetical protein
MDQRVPVVGDDEERNVGGQSRDELAEHVVEPAGRRRELRVQRRRRIDVRRPEVVVQAVRTR